MSCKCEGSLQRRPGVDSDNLQQKGERARSPHHALNGMEELARSYRYSIITTIYFNDVYTYIITYNDRQYSIYYTYCVCVHNMIIHTYNLIDSYICNINTLYHFMMYIYIYIYMHLLSTHAYLNLVLVMENKQHVHTHTHHIYNIYIYWLVVWIIFIFPYIGNNPSQLTNIFQRGWNHQPVYIYIH